MASNFWSKLWPLKSSTNPIENSKRSVQTKSIKFGQYYENLTGSSDLRSTTRKHWTTLLQETSFKDNSELQDVLKLRLIVFREGRTKARRCLFDSDTVIREDLTEEVEHSPREDFVQVFEDKFGYKVITSTLTKTQFMLNF